MNIKKLGIYTEISSYENELKSKNVVSQGWEHDVSFLFEADMKEINEWLPIFSQNDKRARNAFKNILNGLKEGDIVLGFEGNTLKGISEIPKNFIYNFDDSLGYKNTLFPMKWVDWEIFCKDNKLSKFTQGGQGIKGIENSGLSEINEYIKSNWAKYKEDNSLEVFPNNCLEKFEELKNNFERKKKESRENMENKLKQLKQQAKMQDFKDILTQKRQIILQGAPGTGKTREAEEIAYNFVFDTLLTEEKKKRDEELKELYKSEQFALIQFHPAYSYEDFVRGIVAETNESGQISYKVKNKILCEMAEKASNNKDAKYVLIIDEINRANLPAVLGELIYALEYRDKPVNSLYELDGKKEFILPSNLYIIGTMNTADRSVGHIDYAIRRRFAFVNIPPDDSVITNLNAKTLFTTIRGIFEKNLSSDFQIDDIMIGHSYFLGEADNLSMRFKYEIKPLLHEYVKDGILTCDIKTINDLKTS